MIHATVLLILTFNLVTGNVVFQAQHYNTHEECLNHKQAVIDFNKSKKASDESMPMMLDCVEEQY